jgi:hypothetical protein
MAHLNSRLRANFHTVRVCFRVHSSGARLTAPLAFIKVSSRVIRSFIIYTLISNVIKVTEK